MMLMLLMLVRTAPVLVGAEGDAAGEESVNVFLELKKPPEEALIVPEMEVAPQLPGTLYLFFLAIAALTFIIVLGYRMGKGRRIARAALMIFTIALTPLIIQTVQAGYSFGNPLDTSNIMLLAYYKDPNGWTLASTVPAFEKYTDHGNYYDGIVRVWMDKKGNEYIGTEFYIDVCVRVRADGWILAWLNRTHSYAYIVFWGHSYKGAESPVIGATVPSRAIQRVFYTAGKTFPGYAAISHYDFTHPDAGKILIFGKCFSAYGSTSTAYIYYTIPASSPLQQIIDLKSSAALYKVSSSATVSATVAIDGNTIVSLPNENRLWHSPLNDPSLFPVTTEVRHTIVLTLSVSSGNAYFNFAFIIWVRMKVRMRLRDSHVFHSDPQWCCRRDRSLFQGWRR